MSGKGNYADAAEDRKSRGRGKAKEVTSEKPFTWCNVSLPDAAKEAIKEQEFDAARFFDWLEALISDRYKVTVSYDDKSDCFLAIVVGRLATRPDYNVGVSSRHSSLETVLLTVQYKFEVLFMGGAIPIDNYKQAGEVWD